MPRRLLPRRRHRRHGEQGYLVVEAAVALPLYIMFMLVVLQISSFAIAQAKISVAVNQTAAEISQFSYVRDRDLKLTNDTRSVIDLLNAFSTGLGGSGDVFGTDGSGNPLEQMIAGSSNDRAVARDLLRKRLDESDRSLRSLGVVGGANGVDLTEATTIFGGDKVVLDAQYQLKVTFFWDVTVDMRATATTARWGNPS